MAAALAVYILLPLFFTSSGCHAQDVHAILLKVVNAVEKLVGFYKAGYQNMNLDGLYGLKVLEGQIQRILNEHEQGQHANLSPFIVQHLGAILHDAKWIGKQAMAAVRADDERYFQKLEFVVAQPWSFLKRHRRVDPTSRWEIPVYQSSINSKLEEGQSDKCMMEVTGHNKTKSSTRGQSGCSLTKDCGLIMTKRGLTDYGITHQLLWTALAEKSGCEKEMNSLLEELGFASVEEMQMEFCTNNYYEMLAVVHVFMMGRVKGNYQDMFLEQQFVCPNLGFFEFLKKDYLEQILSWQQPTGCFGVGSEDDSVVQDQVLQKLPVKMDLNRLSAVNPDKLQNMSKISGLDRKKQQMQQQLKKLKSNNQFLQSVLHNQDGNNDQVQKFHQQPQKLNEEENVLHGIQGQLPVKPAHFADLKLQAKQSPLQRNPQPNPNRKFEVNNANVPGRFKELPENVPLRPQGGFQVPIGLQHDALEKFQGDAHNMLEGRNMPIVPQGNLPNQPQGQRLQNNFQGNPQDADALAVQRVLRDRGMARVQNPDPARGHMPELGARGNNQQPKNPEIPGLLGKRLQGRKMLSVYKTAQGTKRKLLVEKEMPDGCLAHKTGVACGALVMYLRYLIDPGPLDLFAPHRFFPDGPRGLLGDEESYKKVMHFIGNQFQNNFKKDRHDDPELDNVVEFDGRANRNDDKVEVGEGDEDDEEEEEEEEEGDEDEYDDRDEMYPDTGGVAGQQHERKVVHFGANDETLYKEQKREDYDDNKEGKNDEYANENEDEEEEEDGADYIKRVKGDDDGAANINEKDNNGGDDTEYTYYDDDDNTERGIIKRHKPQAPPQNGARIRTHNRHKPYPPVIDSLAMNQADSPPTKAVVLLLSATSLVLIIFMYRFIKKRRLHIRYHNRSFFKL